MNLGVMFVFLSVAPLIWLRPETEGKTVMGCFVLVMRPMPFGHGAFSFPHAAFPYPSWGTSVLPPSRQ